jgi:uncharacterized beta-barrel protein YwiB (DUF1934 family)
MQDKKLLLHVPTEMKKWADKMYDAEFEGKMRSYHEYRNLYLHYKELNDRGVEYEPTF